MINISFIVPYPQLEEAVREVFLLHPQKDLINPTIKVIAAEQLHTVKLDCDVVIARGYTVAKLKKLRPNIPIIELTINAYDIIRAVQECRKIYNPKKIGFVGSYNAITDVESLSELLDCDIKIYTPESVVDIDTAIEQTQKDGCDSLIGGFSIKALAQSKGINSVVIKTGSEAIQQALNEAIRTVDVVRYEREKSEILKTITQYSDAGIIYVNNNLIIQEINTKAQNFCSGSPSLLYQSKIKDVFPFMENTIKDVLQSAKEKNNELHKIGNTTITANYIPIAVEKTIVGVIINFQNITKIQQAEIQIRKKLSAKGLNAKYNFHHIIYSSELMEKTINKAKKFATVSSNILLVGETGTGKELMAQSIHNASPRKNGPFVAVNCSALPENLLESELFGYADGAFTGATKGGKIGLFELAHNGTLFLDEISEVPISFQSKLLRVLQEKEVRRIGDDKIISIDVRIIAATNRNLKSLVSKGLFRQDLLYRLDVLKLYIPPLRKRQSDILKLFMYFIEKKFNANIKSLTPEAKDLLINYNFSGNVRELRNIAERISVISLSHTIDYENMYDILFPDDIDDECIINQNQNKDRILKIEDEKDLIQKALNNSGKNQTKAAEILGMHRTTLWRKIIKYNIKI